MAQNGCRCRQESGANERNGVGQVSEKNFEYFLFLANFILLLMTTLCVPNGMSLKWLNVDALIWGIYGQLDILKIGIYFKWCPFVIVGLKRSILATLSGSICLGKKSQKVFVPSSSKLSRSDSVAATSKRGGKAWGKLQVIYHHVLFCVP